jgi:hypothetical protein
MAVKISIISLSWVKSYLSADDLTGSHGTPYNEESLSASREALGIIVKRRVDGRTALWLRVRQSAK